jgi:RNA polymerase-binding transcription factor
MSTPRRTARTMPRTASAHYERLEELRRRHREEFKARLGELRVALTPADAVEVKDNEALYDNSSSAGISAAIVEITSRTLQGIEGALGRLESGTYGRCSDCGAEIPATRLRAMPFAERCRSCQELADADRYVLAA